MNLLVVYTPIKNYKALTGMPMVRIGKKIYPLELSFIRF